MVKIGREIKKNYEEKLKELAKKYGVALIYLFGSQAQRGYFFLKGEEVIPDRESDLDLGVVFIRYPEDAGERVRLYGDLFYDLSMLFEPFEIDLVFLQETSSLFQQEAIKGICIYAEDELFQEDYEELVMKKACDLRFKKREFEEDLAEARRVGYFNIEL